MNEGAFGFSELLEAEGGVDWFRRSGGIIAWVTVASVLYLDLNVCCNECGRWYVCWNE